MKKLVLAIIMFLTVFSSLAEKPKGNNDLLESRVKQFIDDHNRAGDLNNQKLIEFGESLDEFEWETKTYYKAINLLNVEVSDKEVNYLDALFTLGRLFQDKHEFKSAYPFFYKISLELENSAYNFQQECKFYEFLGHNYFYFKRNNEAEKIILKAIECSETTSKAKINLNNTLGLIYMIRKDYTKGEHYFRTALEIANRTGDKGWSGVLMGNLGDVSFKLNKFQEAEQFLVVDYEQGLKNDQIASSINALALLVRIDIILNNLDRAKQRFSDLETLIKKNGALELKVSYLYAKIDLLKKTNDYKNAFTALEELRTIQATINQKKDLVNIKNTEFQLEFERKQSQIKFLQESKKLDTIRIRTMWFALTSLLLGGAITIWQILKRRKREKEILKLKNEQIGLELKMAERELRNVIRNLMEKNNLISDLNNDITALQDKTSKSDEEHEALTNTLQSFTLLTEEDWVEFKRLFEKCFPGFFDYFNNNFEDITNAEIRLAALIKLDLENIEMSNALGISPDSVRKTNLRLRKKVGITEQKELQRFIQAI